MQAVIQTAGSLVMAMAVAAFAHFGIALKDCPCAKATAAIHRVSDVRKEPPRTIRRAPAGLAKDLRQA